MLLPGLNQRQRTPCQQLATLLCQKEACVSPINRLSLDSALRCASGSCYTGSLNTIPTYDRYTITP